MRVLLLGVLMVGPVTPLLAQGQAQAGPVPVRAGLSSPAMPRATSQDWGMRESERETKWVQGGIIGAIIGGAGTLATLGFATALDSNISTYTWVRATATMAAIGFVVGALAGSTSTK
ncbi:MAG: hypothetical protein SFU57_01545 [Gemmatimonadales bacterium]|nr:hypothetical protein [Gemmatimonadales bacterium]